MNKIRISACVPTYNREKLLRSALSSLLNQSEPVDEIVVVDDGSTDNTESVVKSFGRTETIKYFKYIRDKGKMKHLTIVDAFNYCIDKATCDFVSIIGDDDLVAYNWCETVKRTIESKKEDINAFFFSFAVFFENSGIKRIWRQVKNDAIYSGINIFTKTNNMFGISGNLVFRKKFMIESGKLSREYGTFFDKEFSCRLAFLKEPVFFSKEIIFFLRSHKGQATNLFLHGKEKNKDKINFFFQSSEFICRILHNYLDLFLKEDLGFQQSINRKYLKLFASLARNSYYFRELSFLFMQGFFKALTNKDRSIHKGNCEIMLKYFHQIKSRMFRLFLFCYFLRYWIVFINLKSYISSLFIKPKDQNLKLVNI